MDVQDIMSDDSASIVFAESDGSIPESPQMSLQTMRQIRLQVTHYIFAPIIVAKWGVGVAPWICDPVIGT